MTIIKKVFSDWNTGKEIRVVWCNFSTLQRRNKLKFNKRRTMLDQIQYIIIFDIYADHSILKPGIATQHNILNFDLAAIQITSKSRVGRGNNNNNVPDELIIANFLFKKNISKRNRNAATQGNLAQNIMAFSI